MSAAAHPARPPRAARVGIPASPDGARLALRKGEAVQALGVSDETFDRYIKPCLAVVRVGSVRLYAIAELERYLADAAELPLPEVES